MQMSLTFVMGVMFLQYSVMNWVFYNLSQLRWKFASKIEQLDTTYQLLLWLGKYKKKKWLVFFSKMTNIIIY